jgi:hypothetical protein
MSRGGAQVSIRVSGRKKQKEQSRACTSGSAEQGSYQRPTCNKLWDAPTERSSSPKVFTRLMQFPFDCNINPCHLLCFASKLPLFATDSTVCQFCIAISCSRRPAPVRQDWKTAQRMSSPVKGTHQ